MTKRPRLENHNEILPELERIEKTDGSDDVCLKLAFGIVLL